MTKQRGMIFNSEMVRALLEGRKTQTRRPIKEKIFGFNGSAGGKPCGLPMKKDGSLIKSPYGKIGDIIWVRETCAVSTPYLIYKADQPYFEPDNGWTPSIHMPRKASRIDLEITNVRVERIQDITMGEVQKEGVQFDVIKWPYTFDRLWNSIYPGSWERNDWVWVYDFKIKEQSNDKSE